jgi:hypothetical protein
MILSQISIHIFLFTDWNVYQIQNVKNMMDTKPLHPPASVQDCTNLFWLCQLLQMGSINLKELANSACYWLVKDDRCIIWLLTPPLFSQSGHGWHEWFFLVLNHRGASFL